MNETGRIAPSRRKGGRTAHHVSRFLLKYALSILLAAILAALLVLFFRHQEVARVVESYALFALANPALTLLVALMLGLAWGLVGSYFGIQYLFWQDTARARVAASFGITLFLAVIGVLAHYDYDANEHGRRWEELHRFFLLKGVPILLLLLAPPALPGLFPEVSRTFFAYSVGWRRHRGRRGALEQAREQALGWVSCFGPYLLGIALGMLLIGGTLAGVDWVRPSWGPRFASTQWLAALRAAPHLARIVVLYIGFLFAYAILATLAYRLVTPAVAICVLMSLLALTIALPTLILMSHEVQPFIPRGVRTHSKLVVFVAFWGVVAAWIALANSDPYKLTFPGLGRYYPRGDLGPIALRQVVRDVYFPGPGAPESGTLLDSQATLENWLRRVRPTGEGANGNGNRNGDGDGDGDAVRAGLPKLVVVAVSGGATRSAYWTSVVLDRIEREIPGFGAHVRVITGASGGMLGAAHYVNWLSDRVHPRPAGGSLTATIPTDSIKVVARSIALRGMILGITPRFVVDLCTRWFGGFVEDRGRHLENHWKAIRYPFRSLRRLEEEGAIPSLIFSPMIVEDGRRLLISNLDLGSIVKTGGSALLDRHAGRDRLDYSLTAVEFYRLFPLAEDFRLSTAVRMSASFPFISPAVSLPTDPPRRVVDAGYYDNFGIQVAASWLRVNLDWLTAHTSGVVLIQIRDALSQEDRLDVADAPRGVRARLRRGFSFFTSPVEGMRRARNASSSFRNDAAIQNLGATFTDRMRGKVEHPAAFFTTVAFENSARVTFEPSDPSSWPGDDRRKVRNATGVALNWYLSAAERESLATAIPATPPEASPWAHRPNRLERIRWLRECADASRGTQRIAHLKQLEQARNFERLVQLRAWWDGPEPAPHAAPDPSLGLRA